jgi:sodium-coupled neutral amino acid transporter 11
MHKSLTQSTPHFTGDTIAGVIAALFPSLAAHPYLSVLVSRRYIITICTVGITFPLSLHRDLAKLAKTSAFALMALLMIILSVLIEAPHLPAEQRGDPARRFSFANAELFQAISVICFGASKR